MNLATLHNDDGSIEICFDGLEDWNYSVLIGQLLVNKERCTVLEVNELDMITDTAIDVHMKLDNIPFIFRRDDAFGNRLCASDSQYMSQLECLANRILEHIDIERLTEQ